MSNVTFSIITPTRGRPGLKEMLEWTWIRMGHADEQIVLYDGMAVPDPRPTYLEGIRYLSTPHTSFWGNFQRDAGLRIARCSHILFVDDDDAVEQLVQVRKIVAAEPDVPHQFRLEGAGAVVLPERGSGGGSSLVLPNDPTKLPVWGLRFSPTYIEDVEKNWGTIRRHPETLILTMRVFERFPDE